MNPAAVESRARRAAKKAETRAALDANLEQPAEPEIEVVAAAPEPPKSLKEKLFGFVKAEEPAKKASRGRPASSKDNLVVTMLPTVAASFIATYSANLLPAEYRACAPQQAEVAGMLTPIMAIIGRRVEIVGKASQDAIDMANALVMGLAYATRASITYMDIKRGIQQDDQKQETGSSAASAAADRGIRANQRASVGIDRSRVNGSISEILDEAAGIPGRSGADDVDDAEGNERSEAAIFAELLQRDRSGRARLGLLPGTLSGTNHSAHPAVE